MLTSLQVTINPCLHSIIIGSYFANVQYIQRKEKDKMVGEEYFLVDHDMKPSEALSISLLMISTLLFPSD